MHGRTRLSFWQHHALTWVIAVPLLAIARSIGRLADIGDAPDILLHSAIIVSIAYPILTAGAYVSMRYLPKHVPLQYRAILGCVAMAPLLSVLGPIVSWFVGIGPPPIVSAVTREELAAAIAARYPFILLGFAGLGALIWMGLNFSWWRESLSEGEQSERRLIEAKDDGPDSIEPSSSGDPKFVSKLPFAKRGDLWALSSELHYVRIYTSRGHDLVLMRLSDAIEQTEGVEGLQIHRSHWVASDGVARIKNTGGKMQIVLRNDVELPVSRSHQGAVRNIMNHLLD